MPDIGVPELLIIAVIVLLLFGPGKAADLGGSLGKSIREFRKATREDDGHHAAISASAASGAGSATAPAAAAAPDATSARFCTECGAEASGGEKFCVSCGKPLAA
jgi:sec-independent protein translocase protein TatA